MVTKRIPWVIALKTIALHLLFWILIVTYFAWGFGFKMNPKQSFINVLTFLPGHILMAYSLVYFLVPKYLLQKKFLHFFVGLFLVLVLCTLYTIWFQINISHSENSISGMTLSRGQNILPFLHVGGMALSVKLLQFWYVQKKRTAEVKQEKTIVELKLLKAQLHPHFLFNTLNNLYSHTLESSPQASEIVMKLTGLFRFMIYESNVPKIPLNKEIELLQNYITLEQIRYGDRLDMAVSITGDIDKYQITPLLLLPFLENAFKHGASKQIDHCWIKLNLALEGSLMKFELVNSFDANTDYELPKVGGLGLKNVKRRLKLLYKDKYHFKAVKHDEFYVIKLELSLEELDAKNVNKPLATELINV